MERLNEVRPLLNTIESIFDHANNELGLRVWNRHGVEIEKALPLEAISSSQDERLLKFVEIRLPQLIKQLDESRRRYADSLNET